ncbi:MAG: hypothetical protein AAF824_10410 [Bacteroidota bacterium]
MKKFLRITAIVVLVLIAIVFTAGFFLNESKPEGTPGPEADALARKMMEAVDHAAWDTTVMVSWSFGGRQEHLWDKERHFAEVKWADGADQYRVQIDINEKKGPAWKNGKAITDYAEAQKLAEFAWKKWVNDSFWLNPVSKVFDPGTARSLVKLDDGSEALMVTYTSGGDTPGDSYLWMVDENGLPISWKMWVSIIPIGGMEFSWEDWKTYDTGVKLAETHVGPFTLKLTDIEVTSAPEKKFKLDPFEELVNYSL